MKESAPPDRPHQPAAFVLITLLAIGWLLHLGRDLLVPLIVALLLCIVIHPLIVMLRRRGVPWGVTVAGIMLVIVAALWFTGRALYQNARSFLSHVEMSVPADEVDPDDVFADPADSAAATAPQATAEPTQLDPALVWRDVRAVFDDIEEGKPLSEIAADLGDSLKRLVPRIAGYLVVGLGAVAGMLEGVFLVIFFMVFIFAEQTMTLKKIEAAAGDRAGPAKGILERAARDVHLYLSVKAGVSLATGICCWVPMALLGVPYAALFGLLTVLLNFIPTFGSILAALFPMVAAWSSTGGFGLPLTVLAIYVVANTIFGNVVEPRILGKQLNLSPLVLLVALIFWTALWGFAGMFLAVPLTRTLQLVFANIPSLRPAAILMSNGEALDDA